MPGTRILSFLLFVACAACAQEEHSHAAPEQLGRVSFPISCSAAVQAPFNRAMALAHSFDYSAARRAFEDVTGRDPRCAMAHWGIAFSYFHQLWGPPLVAETIPIAENQIRQAQQSGAATERENAYIHSLAFIYEDAATIPYPARAAKYEQAMASLAATNPDDMEAQVLYALALLANASPSDKTHVRQKKAAEILEPLSRADPQHPGIPHYLIHAYDNAEMAERGLPAARAYAKIAPSAPHALHMPSHIFTRLGLWEDSIQANLAAREAAHKEGDTGEELHAMDYLMYAYLQLGRDTDAARTLHELEKVPKLDQSDFKIAYAATAMPVRYVVEGQQWSAAAAIPRPQGAPPHVVALAVWARGMGFARSGRAAEARQQLSVLKQIEAQLRASSNDYWAVQTGILAREISAWCLQAEHKADGAAAVLRQAADDEDAIEKLPVTPGPIVPAREQLGDLLLEQNHPDRALVAFQAALREAPGRRGSLQGAAQAAALASKK